MLSIYISTAFFLLFPLVWGQCETECEPISSLLSDCSLPPISTEWNDASVEDRNLTGMPNGVFIYEDLGPRTRRIANYSQAECFCVEAVVEIRPCRTCWSKTFSGFGGGELKDLGYSHGDVVPNIAHDCDEFGYHEHDDLAYPSTTRLSSISFETEVPSDSEDDKMLCHEMCGVVSDHTRACNLTPLDVDTWPDRIFLPEDEYDYELTAAVLLNRTSAECFCTLQVMRRITACRLCLSVREDEDATPDYEWRIEQYTNECHDYGYWTDSEFIRSSRNDFYEDEPTGSSTSATHSPTPTEDSGMGSRERRWIGLTAGLGFFTCLFIFV